MRPVVERKSGRSVLMNPTRQKIFQYLCSYPCRHIRAMERDMKLKLPAVIWHLRLLEDAGFLSSARFRRKKVYFPKGMIAGDDVPVFAALENRHVRQICASLMERGGMTQRELWAATGTYQQSVLWYLSYLEKLGIVAAKRTGTRVSYNLTRRLEDVKEHGSVIWDDFKTSLLKRLANDGVAPRVLRDDAKGIIIQLDTGQRRFNLKVERI